MVRNSLSSFVKLGKDITYKWDRTNVFYKFGCENCSATCVGETKRELKVRINEHKKNTNLETVVNQHRREFGHEFDFENVKIIDYESNYKKKLHPK